MQHTNLGKPLNNILARGKPELDVQTDRMRRGRRDPTDTLELGSPIYVPKSLQMKRFTRKKLFKYLILVVLGVAIHSIYREIFKVGFYNLDYIQMHCMGTLKYANNET